jgi:hypothetical protein
VSAPALDVALRKLVERDLGRLPTDDLLVLVGDNIVKFFSLRAERSTASGGGAAPCRVAARDRPNLWREPRSQPNECGRLSLAVPAP